MKRNGPKQWFVLALPLAAAAAWLLPQWGAESGFWQPEIFSRCAVVAIFLLQGLTLPVRSLREGAGHWRLHLGVQAFVFLIFPLLGLLFDAVIGQHLTPDLRLGFLLLAVLPSTIMMSVALTTLAGGDTVAALFNAALSNFIGVLVTPLWVAWLIPGAGLAHEPAVILREVAALLLLPLAAGQLLRVLGVANWADSRGRALSTASDLAILLIVFLSFRASAQSHAWSSQPHGTLLLCLAGVIALLALALTGTYALGGLLRLSPPQRIVLIFCGSQKSLSTGVPLAKAIFGAYPGLGLILLPIMLYYPLQMFVCGAVAGRRARASAASSGKDGLSAQECGGL